MSIRYIKLLTTGECILNKKERSEIINSSWDLHAIIEQNYLHNPAVKGDDDWSEKQRLLLADMAIHLMQTAISDGPIQLDKLKNNLHAILTISDQFLPNADLKAATEKLYRPGE